MPRLTQRLAMNLNNQMSQLALLVGRFSITRTFILLLTISPLAAQAETLSGQVISVMDGDTLTLMDIQRQSHQIHLAGVGAPKLSQEFGSQAKTHLSALALGQVATADCSMQDQQLRMRCTVTVGGKDIGLAQIRAGMAWAYRQYVGEQTAQAHIEYEQAQFEAKIHRTGLWRSKNPTPPWR